MKSWKLLLLVTMAVSFAAQAQETATGADSKPTAGRSRGLNPDTSLNALVLYTNSNRGNNPESDPQNGLLLQEAEMAFTADVDPYWRLFGLFAIHSEIGPAPDYKPEYEFHPEEVYGETTSLPFVILKAGKFKAAFGRHNLLHTHAYPFIDEPLVQAAFLGEDGLNDTGASASALIPLPWFSELTLQALSGRGEGVETSFGNTSPNALVPVAHFRNLWEIGEETTLQLGLSGAQGKNQTDNNTDLVGADLTLKWRPVVFGTSRAVVISTEAIQRTLRAGTSTEKGQGGVAYAQVQVAPRWWVQGRTEYVEQRDVLDATGGLSDAIVRKNSGLIGFVPTEFSSVRVQYDHLRDAQETPEQRVSLQLNFSIGAHPAHLY